MCCEYLARFDLQGLAYSLNVKFDFLVVFNYMAAVDSIAFTFILLSLLLYSYVCISVLGICRT